MNMSGNLAALRPTRILIVDDDRGFHGVIKQSLKGRYEVRSAYNSDEAVLLLKKAPTDIILLDIQMRTPTEGFDAIPKFREIDPDPAIIMISGLTDVNAFREAMKHAVHDYIPKDFAPEQLAMAIEAVLSRRELIRKTRQQSYEISSKRDQPLLIGGSPAIQRLLKMIEKLKKSNANVLIYGESGTGKEVVASLIRGLMPDGSPAPFISVDSATIQSTTAESTLFGHEKGAFTGADKTKRGLFEEADGGIIFFDELGNMPLEIQAKLLRVIQEKEVLRLGSSRPIPSDFRVISATNRDMDQMAKEGLFKSDLLQRLNVLPIEIPPLRERKEDLPELIPHFLAKIAKGAPPCELSDESMEALQIYDWPGNVRELLNSLIFAHTMATDGKIEVSELPSKIRDAARVGRVDKSAPRGFFERLAEAEKSLLKEEYEKQAGNISKMALSIGMDRSHLHGKLKEFGIHTPTERKKT
jgi:DNA-binding NtrC family response regulator